MDDTSFSQAVATNGLAIGSPSLTGRSLTPYEQYAIQKVAEWKSSRPSSLTIFVDTFTKPITWAVGHCVPKSVVTNLVSSLEVMASKADGVRDILVAAKIRDVSEMFVKSLEECDTIAKHLSLRAERFSMVEGMATEFAGPAVSVPRQLLSALRSIAKIGHCYGYRLDRKIDRGTVIDILEIAMLQEPEERQQVLAALHAALDAKKDPSLGQADVLARTTRAMIAEETLDMIPVVGTAMAFIFDNTFMHHVDDTARYVFKERWLRDTGRVASIPPAAEGSRNHSLNELGLAVGQTIYCVGAVVGFTVTLPVALVRRFVGNRPSPMSLGARHGSDAAVADAREFFAGVRSVLEADTSSPWCEPIET